MFVFVLVSVFIFGTLADGVRERLLPPPEGPVSPRSRSHTTVSEHVLVVVLVTGRRWRGP